MTSRHCFSLLVIGFAAGIFVQPVVGQYAPGSRHSTVATRSVLKSADQVQWADYHAGIVAGPGISGCTAAHVGCSDGVCYGYDNCCCRPHLLGCLRKFVRTLDCLLPCNHFGNGGCLLGGCRPHLFGRGHCGCDVSCTSGCPSCTSPVGTPALSDPFIDDPDPPKPLAEPATGMRRQPAPASASTVASRSSSPYKVTTSREVQRQEVIATTSRHEVTPAAATPASAPGVNPRDRVTARPPAHSRPAPKSSLQRASAEEEVPASGQQVDWLAPPALLPVAIHRMPGETPDNLAIPVNPLRK